MTMTKKFAVSVWKEGNWYIAQCLNQDVASQGQTEQEALDNLREALELFFEEPLPTILPQTKIIEVKINAA